MKNYQNRQVYVWAYYTHITTCKLLLGSNMVKFTHPLRTIPGGCIAGVAAEVEVQHQDGSALLDPVVTDRYKVADRRAREHTFHQSLLEVDRRDCDDVRCRLVRYNGQLVERENGSIWVFFCVKIQFSVLNLQLIITACTVETNPDNYIRATTYVSDMRRNNLMFALRNISAHYSEQYKYTQDSIQTVGQVMFTDTN